MQCSILKEILTRHESFKKVERLLTKSEIDNYQKLYFNGFEGKCLHALQCIRQQAHRSEEIIRCFQKNF